MGADASLKRGLRFTAVVVSGESAAMNVRKIVSGGQTGADQGVERVCDGRFPWRVGAEGRRSERGKSRRVTACASTGRGIIRPHGGQCQDSDGTLICVYGKPDGGSLLTIDFAKQHRKPWLALDMTRPMEKNLARVMRWLKRHPEIEVLNVAGSRRSKAPGIHMAVRRLIRALLQRLPE